MSVNTRAVTIRWSNGSRFSIAPSSGFIRWRGGSSARLATLAEEACDAAVLSAGHSPQDYSEYLLEMAHTVSREGGRRLQVVGMAMPGSGLPGRLRQIFDGLPRTKTSRARVLCTVVLCAMSSVMFAAGTPAPRVLQAPPATAQALQPRFDVVSIKPCPGLPPRGVGRGAPPWAAQISPGYVHWECVTLSQLVDEAYAGSQSPLLNMRGFDRGARRFAETRPRRAIVGRIRFVHD